MNCRQQHTKLKRWFALLDWTCRRFTHVLTTASCIAANTRTWKLVLFVAHCGISLSCLKRHIVLPGKSKVVGVEDISDNSEDYDQIDDLPPFSLDVDPSILLSKEDTPYLRRDHVQGTFIKRKIINVPVDNHNE